MTKKPTNRGSFSELSDAIMNEKLEKTAKIKFPTLDEYLAASERTFCDLYKDQFNIEPSKPILDLFRQMLIDQYKQMSDVYKMFNINIAEL